MSARIRPKRVVGGIEKFFSNYDGRYVICLAQYNDVLCLTPQAWSLYVGSTISRARVELQLVRCHRILINEHGCMMLSFMLEPGIEATIEVPGFSDRSLHEARLFYGKSFDYLLDPLHPGRFRINREHRQLTLRRKS